MRALSLLKLAENRGVAVGSSSYKLASVELPPRTFSSLVLLRLKTTSTMTFLHFYKNICGENLQTKIRVAA